MWKEETKANQCNVTRIGKETIYKLRILEYTCVGGAIAHNDKLPAAPIVQNLQSTSKQSILHQMATTKVVK